MTSTSLLACIGCILVSILTFFGIQIVVQKKWLRTLIAATTSIALFLAIPIYGSYAGRSFDDLLLSEIGDRFWAFLGVETNKRTKKSRTEEDNMPAPSQSLKSNWLVGEQERYGAGHNGDMLFLATDPSVSVTCQILSATFSIVFEKPSPAYNELESVFGGDISGKFDVGIHFDSGRSLTLPMVAYELNDAFLSLTPREFGVEVKMPERRTVQFMDSFISLAILGEQAFEVSVFRNGRAWASQRLETTGGNERWHVANNVDFSGRGPQNSSTHCAEFSRN